MPSPADLDALLEALRAMRNAAELNALLLQTDADDDEVQPHHNLLAACRVEGVDAAYTQLHAEMANAARLASELSAVQENPIFQRVLAFLLTEEEAAARAMLVQEASHLLTVEARQQLSRFAEAAAGPDNADNRTRIERRLSLWDEAWRARAGGPHHHVAEPRQPDPEYTDRLERQPLSPAPADDRALRYHVVTAANSAISPGASVLNIDEVGASRHRTSCWSRTGGDAAAAALVRISRDAWRWRRHGAPSCWAGRPARPCCGSALSLRRDAHVVGRSRRCA